MSTVDHPEHYNSHPSGVECIDVVEHMSFNLGNAVKYIWRAGLKSEDPLEDLKKARWYLNREISRLLAERPLGDSEPPAPEKLRPTPKTKVPFTLDSGSPAILRVTMGDGTEYVTHMTVQVFDIVDSGRRNPDGTHDVTFHAGIKLQTVVSGPAPKVDPAPNVVNELIAALVTKIGCFTTLKRNWDSYDALPISPVAIKEAIGFLLRLSTVDSPPLPEVFPEPDGTVRFEWQQDNIVLELKFLTLGAIEFSREAEGDEEGIVSSDRALSMVLDDFGSVSAPIQLDVVATDPVGTVPDVIASLVSRVEGFRDLQPNWNFQSASPISPEAIKKATQFLLRFATVGSPAPEAFPEPNGSVRLLWEDQLRSDLPLETLELFFYADGKIRLLTRTEEQVFRSSDQVVAAIQRWLSPSSTRVYVAGSSADRGAVSSAIKSLQDAGIVVTYDWTKSEGYQRDLSTSEIVEQVRADLEGIRAADVLWLHLSTEKSEGSSVELGYAIALNKSIFVSGPLGPERVFPYAASVAGAHAFEAHGVNVPETLYRATHAEALTELIARSRRGK